MFFGSKYIGEKWIVPVLRGCFTVFNHVVSKGPTVELTLKRAEGCNEKKSHGVIQGDCKDFSFYSE